MASTRGFRDAVDPSRPMPRRDAAAGSGVRTLLAAARRGLDDASAMSRPSERYATAHLAALRCAAAVLAARARPEAAKVHARRPRNAWALLADVAPELREWAAYFAAGATKRAAAEAGIESAVTARDADDLLRDVETFFALTQTTIGIAPQLAFARMAAATGMAHAS